MTTPCTTSLDTCRIAHRALALVGPQFRLDLRDGIHGLPHWARVCGHGRRLAAALDLDPTVPIWFAFLHDSQRMNDGRDPGHGQRAADFAVRLRHDGYLPELHPSDFERLCEALRTHSDGHTAGDRLVQVCWDADRLDLGRVGTRPLPQRLCTPQARSPEVIELAWRRSIGLPAHRSR